MWSKTFCCTCTKQKTIWQVLCSVIDLIDLIRSVHLRLDGSQDLSLLSATSQSDIVGNYEVESDMAGYDVLAIISEFNRHHGAPKQLLPTDVSDVQCVS